MKRIKPYILQQQWKANQVVTTVISNSKSLIYYQLTNKKNDPISNPDKFQQI